MTNASSASHIVHNERGVSSVQVPQNRLLLPVLRKLRRNGAAWNFAVATPLIRAGYQIVLIDSTITPDYKKRVLEEVRDALCLGISLVTGPMIRETVEIAKAIKAWNPDFPCHSRRMGIPRCCRRKHWKLLTSITSFADRVKSLYSTSSDILKNNSAPDFVAGIGFKRDNKLIFTPERALKPLIDMPPKAYHLADFDAYDVSAA